MIDTNDDRTLLSEYVQSITIQYEANLKVGHLNAQSLCDVAHQSEFLDTFSNCGLDIITVSETWFKDGDKFNLPGYNMFNINRKDRNGGGVAVFSKTSFPTKVLETSQGDFDKPEYLLLQVQVGTVKILFAGIYRRPKAGYMNLFMEDFYKHVINFKYCFVCGDINAGFGRGGEDTRVITEVLNLCNLTCVPFQPTFHTTTCDSNLDIISSNCPELLFTFGQTPASGFSGHDFIFSVFDLSVPRAAKSKTTFRNFNKIVEEQLMNDVLSAQWDEVYCQNEINGKLTSFNKIISDLMDKHAPMHTCGVKKQSAPWMNSYIRQLIRNRNRLRKKHLRTKCPLDSECFKEVRNKVKQAIRSAKAKYYYDKFKDSGNDSKKNMVYCEKSSPNQR